MKKGLIRIIAYLVMIPIMCIGVVFGILWNLYLIINYVGFRFKRKWKAGVKEVRKPDVHK
jgi:hypothetical protein